MKTEYVEFLKTFEGVFGSSPAVASHLMYSDVAEDGDDDAPKKKKKTRFNCRHPQIREWAESAIASGLLAAIPAPETKVSNLAKSTRNPVAPEDAIFNIDMTLTDIGREFCGLPPLLACSVKEEKKPKKTKPVKQSGPDLFGDDE